MAVGDFDEKSECHESNSGGGSSSPSAMMETAPLQRLRENLVLVRSKREELEEHEGKLRRAIETMESNSSSNSSSSSSRSGASR